MMNKIRITIVFEMLTTASLRQVDAIVERALDAGTIQGAIADADDEVELEFIDSQLTNIEDLS